MSWLHPEAHDADDNLGGRMEAYYDEHTKKWVFPGEDPDAPGPAAPPPPPTSMGRDMGGFGDMPAAASGAGDSDMLSAMMAPPPSRRSRDGAADGFIRAAASYM